MYLWETHAHTAGISPCGHVSPERMAQMYAEAGYTGVVLTNHLNPYIFGSHANDSWEQKLRWFFGGGERLQQAAGTKLRVLCGAELRFYGADNDYLVYGMTEDWLRAHPDIFEWGVQKFYEMAEENGFLFMQAHPFRNNMTMVNPRYLHGIEAYNGNCRHDSRNDIAAAWAKKFSLLTTAGSDFHEEEDAARGGILTERDIRTMEDFIAAVREGAALKTTG